MRYLTAGESHGKCLTVIIEGVPAGLPIIEDDLNHSLQLRQQGYGRGGRMKIEKDQVAFTAGVRHGYTLGSPIAITIENKDWVHWSAIMGHEPIQPNAYIKRIVTKPRPGHADLSGGMKYGHRDLRNVLERSSARETAARVVAGAVAKVLLKGLGVETVSHVVEIGGIRALAKQIKNTTDTESKVNDSPVRCLDSRAAKQMMAKIDSAKENGDSLGGIVEVLAFGMPPGIGSYVHYDRKLDAKIAGSIISINAFKGVEFGIGFEASRQLGSEVQDEIFWEPDNGFYRGSNHLGGFEGGMTNGMPLIIRGVMKPIPTLYKPLMSVDIDTKEPFKASVERSDSCAVPAASIVCEHVVAFELADAIVNQFYSDQYQKLQKQFDDYRNELLKY